MRTDVRCTVSAEGNIVEWSRRWALDWDGKLKAPPPVALIVVVGVEVKETSQNRPAVVFCEIRTKSIFRATARFCARSRLNVKPSSNLSRRCRRISWPACFERADLLQPVKPRAVRAPGSAGSRARPLSLARRGLSKQAKARWERAPISTRDGDRSDGHSFGPDAVRDSEHGSQTQIPNTARRRAGFAA
jgi:hypothetical protein